MKKIAPEMVVVAAGPARSNRPIMVLLEMLGRRMTLRILWELRDGRLTFRALLERAETNPAVLNVRIREMRNASIVDRERAGYGLTKAGVELLGLLLPLVGWSEKWVETPTALAASETGGSQSAVDAVKIQ